MQVFRDLLEKQHCHFWKPVSDSTLAGEIGSINSLPHGVKRITKEVLACLTKCEAAIITNIGDILLYYSDNEIIGILLDFQKAMEGVHLLSYKKIDEVLGYKIDDRMLTMINKNVEVMRTCLNNRSLGCKLVGMICCEGILFQTMFLIFFILKRKAACLEICQVNAEVLVDESYHTATFIEMYNRCEHKCTRDEIYEIMNMFITNEDQIIEDLLSGTTIDDRVFLGEYNIINLKQHVRYTADKILKRIGLRSYYGVAESPLEKLVESSHDLHCEELFFDLSVTAYGLDVDNKYVEDEDPDYN
jgi:ribonucleotide reductase beta subunit family protein with ferritin-like domain